MQIVLKVKGVDDFGRKSIGPGIDKYSHHYPSMSVNDILIYYYPPGSKGNKIPTVRVCQVTQITERYTKEEGFYYEEGRMKKINPDNGDLNQWLIKLRRTHPEVSNRISDLINKAVKKYNPELIPHLNV